MKKYLFILICTFFCSIAFAGNIKGKNVPSFANEEAPITIYGALVMGNQGQTPCGIYSFNVSDKPQMTTVHVDPRINSLCNGTYANGKYYAYVAEFQGGYMMTKLSFLVFNTDDWSVVLEKELQPNVLNRPTHVFYDAASEKLYAYIVSQQTFYEVNIETGALTQVCKIAGKYFNMFAADDYGKIYATDSNGDFYTVDLQQATCTLIGNTNFGTTTTSAGVIDAKTGRFFMAYCPSYGSVTKLVEINPNTGVGTELAVFPGGEIFSSLFIKNEASTEEQQIPGQPSDLNVTYKVPGEYASTIKVVSPLVAFDKKTPLTGNMKIRFYVDDTNVGEVTDVAPGVEVSMDYTFTEGLHFVKAEAESAQGVGPNIVYKTFAGFDVPQPVTDVLFSIDEQGNYQLSWKAPEKGINNGEIDKSVLNYQIIGYPDKNVIAQNEQGTSYSGKINSKELKDYYFGITAVCGAQKSEETQSNHIVFGESVNIPYVEDFQSTVNWPLYTCVDYNGDGLTWVYDTKRKCASYLGNVNAGDDFLFTPALKMRASISYTLSFGAESGFNQSSALKIYTAQSTEIPWGGPAEMNCVKDIPSIEDSYTGYSVTFTPKEDGIYYFAFECYSNPKNNLHLKNFNIVASAAEDAPADVSDLKVVPGEKGKLEVNISFKAPTTLMNGNNMEEGGISSIHLYRGDDPKPLHVFDHPANGETISYLDENVPNGKNVYRIMTLNETGNSAGLVQSVWVGEDFAMNPEDFNVQLVGDSCIFTWKAPKKGFNNGYIDYDNLTYTIMYIVDNVLADHLVLASGIKDLTYTAPRSTFEQFVREGEQVSINFSIVPVTSIGDGVPAFTNCILGESYKLPYEESFSNKVPSTYPWGVVVVEGGVSWYMVGDSPISDITPYDNDGGMAMFYQKNPGMSEARLQSPKISIENSTEPILEFYMFHRATFDDENNYLQVEVIDENGTYIEVGEKIVVSGDFGWKKHQISLKSLENKVFRLSFRGRASEGIDFYIDHIRIMEKEELVFPAVTDLKGELSEDHKSFVLTWSTPKKIEKLNLIGYYIYCDGQKLMDDYVTECTYTVQLTDNNDHIFAVSVIYNEGDSPLSNEVSLNLSGIEEEENSSVRVYAYEKAIHIENAQGATYKIYDLTGKLVEEGVSDNHSEIYVTKGIYLVKVEGTLYKCIVL